MLKIPYIWPSHGRAGDRTAGRLSASTFDRILKKLQKAGLRLSSRAPYVGSAGQSWSPEFLDAGATAEAGICVNGEEGHGNEAFKVLRAGRGSSGSAAPKKRGPKSSMKHYKLDHSGANPVPR